MFPVELQRLRKRQWRKQPIRLVPEMSIWLEEPIAAAIGAGVDVTKPFGNLVVDIGAGTSDVAVISLAGVVVSASVKVAGDTFNQAILNYVRKNHGLFIMGEDMAEKIKIQIGTAIEESNPRTMEVKGRNVITGLPKTVTLTSEEIRVALKDATSQIVETVMEFRKDTAGTGCGYCRQRNRTYRRRCPSSWDGYTDRAENRSKYTDCAGCNERGRSGNR